MRASADYPEDAPAEGVGDCIFADGLPHGPPPGLFDLAIQDCTQALALNPNIATAYHTRGMAYKSKGLLDRAREDFQKSCELGDINGCQAYRELSKPKNDLR